VVITELKTGTLAQTVLIHLSQTALGQVLTEAQRVLAPGGRMVSADQDGDTWTIDHPDRDTTRRIVRFNSDRRYADGWTGRKLARLFLEAGFSGNTAEVLALQTLVATYTAGKAIVDEQAARSAVTEYTDT
jgi:hypothetical protein